MYCKTTQKNRYRSIESFTDEFQHFVKQFRCVWNQIVFSIPGSVLISTRVMKEKVTFPWWIVIIASIGSLLVVIALIFGLYRGNFFKKKEVNKVNDYDIDDVDGCDVDEPMRKCRSAHQSTHSTTSA